LKIACYFSAPKAWSDKPKIPATETNTAQTNSALKNYTKMKSF